MHSYFKEKKSSHWLISRPMEMIYILSLHHHYSAKQFFLPVQKWAVKNQLNKHKFGG